VQLDFDASMHYLSIIYTHTTSIYKANIAPFSLHV